MNAKEFLLTDPKIHEAVSNGYDIRLEEHEWIEKMELYALTKQGSINTNVVRPESQVGGGELLQGEAVEKGVCVVCGTEDKTYGDGVRQYCNKCFPY